MSVIQAITLLTAILFLFQVIMLTAKNKLQDKQAFVWIIFAFGGVIIAMALPFFNQLAAELGISYMPTVIFMIAFFIVLTFLVYHTSVLSRHQSHEKKLIQEFAMMDKELRELKQALAKEGFDK